MAKDKQRILLISARSDIGGGPKQLAEIIDHLSHRIDFYVAAPSQGEFAHFFKEKSAGFCDIPHRSISPWAFLKVMKFIRTHHIQLIHTHGFGAGAYALLPSLFGAKVLHTFHGLHFHRGVRAKLKTYIEIFLSLTRVEHICVSLSEKRKALALGINPKVIPNGISTAARRKHKASIQWPPRRAGVISRLDPFKNVRWVVEHFRALENQWPGIQLEIVGDGEEKNELISLVQNNGLTNLVSFIEDKCSTDFFEHIDLLICPSKGEGLPYTVLEAMSFGVPIIASNVPGHNDLLSNENLFCLEAPDFHNLAPQNQIERNRDIIEQHFDLNNNLKILEELYRQLL